MVGFKHILTSTFDSKAIRGMIIDFKSLKIYISYLYHPVVQLWVIDVRPWNIMAVLEWEHRNFGTE